MQKIGDSTSTANGAKEFTKGQPGTGIDATVITAEWLNAIQRELVNLVLGGGLTIVPGDDSQVLKAIQAIQLAAATWAKLSGKPTTVSGFGITDAFTKSETAIAIQKAVSDLVASSPDALDTLNELAEALGNDPNFATTVTNKLASKADKATSLAGYGITNTYTKDEITAMIAQASAMPVGSMIGFPVDKVAPGFLELDGSVKSTAAYPDLATFLGGAFNKGDEGAGNFRLPESRAEFLRGWDHGRGVDAGRAIGSMQLDSLQGFRLETMRSKTSNNWGNDDGGAGDPAYGPPMGSATPGTRPRNLTGAFVSDGVNGAPRVGGETRARNLAVMWCIKAWNAPINQGNIDIAALVPLAAQATEINQGTAKVATAAQMLDSENDSVMATPKKLRLGFKFSPGANGYITFPSWMGGLIIQWGALSMAQDTAAVATMSIAFPAANFWEGVTGSINRITGGTTQSGTNVTARTLSTITIANDDAAQVVRWITVGY